MGCFANWETKHVGLFTFAHSQKHVGLYQKFGFWPRFLTAIMSKPIEQTGRHSPWSRFSKLPKSEREASLSACRELTDAIYEGLDVGREIHAVVAQGGRREAPPNPRSSVTACGDFVVPRSRCKPLSPHRPAQLKHGYPITPMLNPPPTGWRALRGRTLNSRPEISVWEADALCGLSNPPSRSPITFSVCWLFSRITSG